MRVLLKIVTDKSARLKPNCAIRTRFSDSVNHLGLLWNVGDCKPSRGSAPPKEPVDPYRARFVSTLGLEPGRSLSVNEGRRRYNEPSRLARIADKVQTLRKIFKSGRRAFAEEITVHPPDIDRRPCRENAILVLRHLRNRKTCRISAQIAEHQLTMRCCLHLCELANIRLSKLRRLKLEFDGFARL